MSQVLINQYLGELSRLRQVSGSSRETVLREAFKDLLKGWGRQLDLIFVPEYPIETPPHEAGLQAVDYFLWALQRHFERGESRYAELLWPQVGLVHAVDETAVAAYGTYDTKKKPLEWNRPAAKERASGI